MVNLMNEKKGMQAVDAAIEKGIDLDGTPIPPRMLDLYKKIMDEENKRERSGVKNQWGIDALKLVLSTLIKTL